MKFLLILAKNSAKTEIKPLPLCAISLETSSYSQIFCELLSLKDFFDSNSFQTPSIVIVFRHVVPLRPFTLFLLKTRLITLQKFLKFSLLGNCFVDLFPEVEILYQMNFKFFLGGFLER